MEQPEFPIAVLYIRPDGFTNTGGGIFKNREEAQEAINGRAARGNLDGIDIVIIYDRRLSTGVLAYGNVLPPPEVVARVDWK